MKADILTLNGPKGLFVKLTDLIKFINSVIAETKDEKQKEVLTKLVNRLMDLL